MEQLVDINYNIIEDIIIEFAFGTLFAIWFVEALA